MITNLHTLETFLYVDSKWVRGSKYKNTHVQIDRFKIYKYWQQSRIRTYGIEINLYCIVAVESRLKNNKNYNSVRLKMDLAFSLPRLVLGESRWFLLSNDVHKSQNFKKKTSPVLFKWWFMYVYIVSAYFFKFLEVFELCRNISFFKATIIVTD